MELSQRTISLLTWYISICAKLKIIPFKYNSKSKKLTIIQGIDTIFMSYINTLCYLLYCIYIWLVYYLMVKGYIKSASTVNIEIIFLFALGGTFALVFSTNTKFHTNIIQNWINRSIQFYIQIYKKHLKENMIALSQLQRKMSKIMALIGYLLPIPIFIFIIVLPLYCCFI